MGIIKGVGPDGLVPFPTGGSEYGWHKMESLGVCEYAWYLTHIAEAGQAGPSSGPMMVGTLCHIGRAQYLADGRVGDRWHDRVCEYAAQESVESRPLTTALAVLDAYTHSPLGAASPNRQVVGVEYTSERVLSIVPIEWTVRVTARYDAVERLADGSFVVNELKTSSKRPDAVYEQYRLHGQLLTQDLVWNEKDWGGPLTGIKLEIWSVSGGQPVSYMIVPTDYQRAWFKDVILDRAARAAVLRGGAHPKRNGVGHACMYCEYKDLCISGEHERMKVAP